MHNDDSTSPAGSFSAAATFRGTFLGYEYRTSNLGTGYHATGMKAQGATDVTDGNDVDWPEVDNLDRDNPSCSEQTRQRPWGPQAEEEYEIE